MNPTITRRCHPAKPVKQKPEEKAKTATSAEALELLNQFMRECRREIRKRETLLLKGRLNETDCDSVSFLGESFSLTINFNERFRV